MSGEMEAVEAEEHEKFDAYIDKYVEDTLDDGEHNPITYGEN